MFSLIASFSILQCKTVSPQRLTRIAYMVLLRSGQFFFWCINVRLNFGGGVVFQKSIENLEIIFWKSTAVWYASKLRGPCERTPLGSMLEFKTTFNSISTGGLWVTVVNNVNIYMIDLFSWFWQKIALLAIGAENKQIIATKTNLNMGALNLIAFQAVID